MVTITIPNQTNLREIRRKCNISMLGLATLARTSPATLTQIERFGYMPGSDIRARIADVLSVTPGEIWPQLKSEESNSGS
jgi:transcriptional regulator with XRE-family HTH domain